MEHETPKPESKTAQTAKRLKGHLYSEEHPHLVSLVCGVTSGLGVAMTVEWNKHFEASRHVPVWETVLVASIATTAAMWVSFVILHALAKRRSGH